MKKTLRAFKKVRKPQRTNSLGLSTENDNTDGYNQACNENDNPMIQTTQELAELLGLTSGANNSEAGSCCPVCPETGSELIQRHVSQYFPKPPEDLDKDLQPHLLNVQDTMVKEIERLGPKLEKLGLMGCLIDRYHRQTFDRLNDLLQNICSSKNSLVLMKWVLHTYLSPDLLGHRDLQQMDPIKKVDLLLLTKWVTKAEIKLRENVQKEVRRSLEEILQIERNQEGCHHEEAYVGFYVDTVACIEAIPKEARKISSSMSDDVREVCFQELLTFLKTYSAEQTEKKAEMDKQETTHFFKTLNTCKELKQHIRTNSKGIRESLLQEMMATLENMEAFALKCLMEIVSDIAERNLQNYFKTANKQFSLITEVQTHFPKFLRCGEDMQKRVMDEAYRLIVHIYLKHLVQSKQSKPKKKLSPDVGQTIKRDVESLHLGISDLAPGVQQWNLMLLKVTELLDYKSTDAVKLTVASMQRDCPTWSNDQKLVPELLRWIGLSKRQVTEVLDSLPVEIPRSVS